MKAITFTINLLEPLLAIGLEGDPNAGVSMKYIAGSVLRGAIIGLYLRDGNSIDANDKDSRNLFFDGKVCYLNSYPQILSQRSFPTPFAWQKMKDEDTESFYNFAIKEREEKTSYKNLNFPFCAFETSNDVISFSPKFRLAVHTQRDAKKGRSTSDEGAVFRYESIAEGTKFSGAIISECDNCLKEIKGLIEKYKKVVFGGSRSAGYGKAEFCEVEIVENWKEFGSVENKVNKISIYVLSNILIRDDNGNFKSELTAEDLKIDGATIEPQNTFVQTEIVGGFNQKWGLPLPQMLSIKAGSVFTFSPPISTDSLKELVEKGIGEKLVEGFGRIAFNLTTSKSLNEIKPTANAGVDKSIIESKIRDRILERVLCQKLDSQIVKLTDNNSIKGSLSNSQISRLRMFIRQLLRNETYDLTKLDAFYKELKGNGKAQFESVRVNGKPFISWTAENHFEKTWSLILGGKPITGESLQNKYNLLLIDGVLAKKAKERE